MIGQLSSFYFFFFQAEDGIRDWSVTGVQTCALPICLVIPQNEQAYASVVGRAGRSFRLRQVFVHRAGHCAFTPAETITSVRRLLRRSEERRVGKEWRSGGAPCE